MNTANAAGNVLETEVCIIGAGPAGIVTALRLAQLGHHVLLVEKGVAGFGRYESIAQGISPLLDFIGLGKKFNEAGFHRVAALYSNWDDCGQAAQTTEVHPCFIAGRNALEEMFLQSVRETNIELVMSARAEAPVMQGGYWYIPVLHEGKEKLIKARYVVNATGRHNLFQAKKKRFGAATQAFYANWNSNYYGHESMMLEAAADHWIWGAPVAPGVFHISVFVDSKYRSGHQSAPLKEFYLSLIGKSPMFSALLNGALRSEVKACDATPYYCGNAVTENCIHVGDALVAIDPLSSQGVIQSISSALRAGIVVHTILSQPENIEAALSFYESYLEETVSHHTSFTAGFYSKPAAHFKNGFWEKRSSKSNAEAVLVPTRGLEGFPPLQSVIRLAPNARMKPVACIQNNLVSYHPGLYHPGLARPTVFYKNILLSPLITSFSGSLTMEEVIAFWSGKITHSQSLELIRWLWAYGIIDVV